MINEKDFKELQDLRTKECINECLEKEREISESSYARKIVEIIVFSMVGIILASFLYGIINLIIAGYVKR